MWLQCGDDDEVPVKKPKHSSGGKSAATSLPSSDCELKVAARLKELKGKARSKFRNFFISIMNSNVISQRPNYDAT